MKPVELVECPVCHVGYSENSINGHIAQAAYAESQHHIVVLMQEALKLGDGNHNIFLPNETVKEVLKDCPHWKYLLKNQKKVDTRPVKKKKI